MKYTHEVVSGILMCLEMKKQYKMHICLCSELLEGIRSHFVGSPYMGMFVLASVPAL